MPLTKEDYRQESLRELAEMIQKLRNDLVRIGTSEGLSSPRTIQVSQMLDRYLVKYQLLVQKNRR
ncbi:aspartyl-phosphate phosphatase Spo0E family protein [Cytobacillus spongiae]|uniref:aspartyl-phosphate phosphatase Spo0E family protein n=1 Tax=Cytobacillus spongiae TaxID=2901381 RepID=UPI001F2F38B7|nr:aspartyl-phosphate phosphatase Spo0E family protein [Cytobacillus spongiae]UII54320.1 aspartyl-phosphate phosphatase Spo0E family protein [Cytobacillus spongiae]